MEVDQPKLIFRGSGSALKASVIPGKRGISFLDAEHWKHHRYRGLHRGGLHSQRKVVSKLAVLDLGPC